MGGSRQRTQETHGLIGLIDWISTYVFLDEALGGLGGAVLVVEANGHHGGALAGGLQGHALPGLVYGRLDQGGKGGGGGLFGGDLGLDRWEGGLISVCGLAV